MSDNAIYYKIDGSEAKEIEKAACTTNTTLKYIVETDKDFKCMKVYKTSPEQIAALNELSTKEPTNAAKKAADNVKAIENRNVNQGKTGTQRAANSQANADNSAKKAADNVKAIENRNVNQGKTDTQRAANSQANADNAAKKAADNVKAIENRNVNQGKTGTQRAANSQANADNAAKKAADESAAKKAAADEAANAAESANATGQAAPTATGQAAQTAEAANAAATLPGVQGVNGSTDIQRKNGAKVVTVPVVNADKQADKQAAKQAAKGGKTKSQYKKTNSLHNKKRIYIKNNSKSNNPIQYVIHGGEYITLSKYKSK
jgi:hypothetical protein